MSDREVLLENLRKAVTSATICKGMYATDQKLVDAIIDLIRLEVADALAAQNAPPLR